MSNRAVRPPRPPGRIILLVGLGGAGGTAARAAIGAAFPAGPGEVPVATLAVNVTGALLLAVLVTLVTDRHPSYRWLRPLLGAGFLGSYTTFSAFALEITRLGLDGHVVRAAGYAATSVVAGLAAAIAGVVLARWWLRGWAGRPEAGP